MASYRIQYHKPGSAENLFAVITSDISSEDRVGEIYAIMKGVEVKAVRLVKDKKKSRKS